MDTATSSALLQIMFSICSRSLLSKAMFVLMADNASSGLKSLCGKTATAALTLADHLSALLAGGDAVAVAFEDFLGDPSDDGRSVLGSLKLLHELLFELFDI